MKIKRMKNLVVAFLIGILITYTITPLTVEASQQIDESSYIVSSLVPQDAIAYAEEIAPCLLASVIDNESSYEVSINNLNDLILGTPFMIYQTEETSSQDIYYFPVMEEQTIKLIISVYLVDNNWNATISKDISDELNELLKTGSANEYVLFTENGSIYAQSKNSLDKLGTYYNFKNDTVNFKSELYESRIEEIEQKSNKDLTRHDLHKQISKKEKLGTKIKKEREMNKDSSVMLMGIGAHASDPFSVNLTNTKQLNMNGCKVSQEGYPVCWAASVATMVRYIKGNTTLTAFDVCDKMGASYTNSEGYGCSVARSALNKYLVSTSYLSSQCSWNTITSNISNKKPIWMGSADTTSHVGHATVVVGYYKSSNNKLVSFWNGDSNQIETATYTLGPSYTNYTYAGYTLRWVESLY